MPDDRAKDQVIMKIKAMLEEQQLPFRLENASGLAEQLLAWAIGRNFMRAEAEDDHIAAFVFQREREISSVQWSNARLATRRGFQLTDILHSGLSRRPVYSPAVNRIDLGLGQELIQSKGMAISPDVQVSNGHRAFDPAQFQELPQIFNCGVSIHAIQANERVNQH